MQGLEPSSTLFRHLFDPHLISTQHWIDSSIKIFFVSHPHCTKLDANSESLRENTPPEQRSSPAEFFEIAASPDLIQSFLAWHFPVNSFAFVVLSYDSRQQKNSMKNRVSNILNWAWLVYLADPPHRQKQQAEGKPFHVSRCISHCGNGEMDRKHTESEPERWEKGELLSKDAYLRYIFDDPVQF